MSWESWESHDHLRAAELNVREQDHGKHSSFHFFIFANNMHPPPKTSSKPIGFFFVMIVHFEKPSWDANMCHFSELIRANRNQVSERVVGSAGLRGGDNRWGSGRGQAGGWLWSEKGKGGYRAPPRKCLGVMGGADTCDRMSKRATLPLICSNPVSTGSRKSQYFLIQRRPGWWGESWLKWITWQRLPTVWRNNEVINEITEDRRDRPVIQLKTCNNSGLHRISVALQIREN